MYAATVAIRVWADNADVATGCCKCSRCNDVFGTVVATGCCSVAAQVYTLVG